MATVGFAVPIYDEPEGDFAPGDYDLVRKFQVETNSLDDGPFTVTRAPGVPLLYSTYATPNEFHGYVRCKRITAKRRAPGSRFWEVTCQYRTPEAKEGGSGGGGPSGTGGGLPTEVAGEHENPMLELPELKTDSENVQEPVSRVYNPDTGETTWIKNSAGYIISPPPMRDSGRLKMTISRNEPLSAPHPYLNIYYQNAVNSDVFWNSQAGQAKIMAIDAQRQIKILAAGAILAYLRVTYVIHFRPDWDTELLDAGPTYRESLDLTKPPRQFVTAEGHPTTGPLNGQGMRLPDNEAPHYIRIRMYPRRPFAALNLPQTWSEVR
jgi:hypothetical protein